jgi:hypothetical protein
MMYWYRHWMIRRIIVKLSINLVKFGEDNIMVIQVGTCDVGKLHEAIQAHLIIPNIALAAHVLAILLSIIRNIMIW